MVLAAYIAMLIFDAVILFGSFYAYHERNWSGWIFVLTVLLLLGSSPRLYGIGVAK